MPWIQLVVILIVIAVLPWVVNTYIPMPVPVKRILKGVVVIAVALWFLNLFGLFSSISKLHVVK